jgi:purine-nucleoside phosphorylase
MSTACEAIAACHMGIRVSGFSAISNKAAGLGAELKHEDILDRSKEMSDKMSRLLTELIESYSDGTE